MYLNPVNGRSISVFAKLALTKFFLLLVSILAGNLYGQSSELQLIGEHNGVYTYAVFAAVNKTDPVEALDFTIYMENQDRGGCLNLDITDSWLGHSGEIQTNCQSLPETVAVRIKINRQDGQKKSGDGIVAIVRLGGGGTVIVDNVDL